MAKIDLEMADSITTWRLTASAHSKGGLLGGTTAPLKVFQDFFVDIDFPVALTQNDEVEVPIAIFNYLAVPQKVKLVVQKEKGSWFELMDKDTKEVTMPAKEVGVVYFRIKAKKIGYQKLTVMAYGSKLSDAVRREVEILPDGKKFETVINGKLEKNIDHEITIPENSIPDSYKIIAKSYPGIGAVLLEGVSGIMRMPHG